MKLRQKMLKNEIEELRQELNKAIERANFISLCDNNILGLSVKLDQLIVQYMESKNDKIRAKEGFLLT